MTTRSQKRKAAEELISTEIETPLPENTTGENPIVGTSKSPKVTTDSLENIKSVLRKEIMSDLTKILAENQKETLKLIAPTVRKQTVLRSTEDSDSDSENIPENATSTPIKGKTNATSSKITPNNSRNNVPISSSAPRPLGAAYIPILLSEVEQEQRPSGNGDREAIVVGAGLCDGEGERPYTAYAPH